MFGEANAKAGTVLILFPERGNSPVPRGTARARRKIITITDPKTADKIKGVLQKLKEHLPNLTVAQLRYGQLGKDKLVSFNVNDDYQKLVIEKLIRYISSISNTMIVQCNHAKNIGRKSDHTYEKASLSYNLKVLKENKELDVEKYAELMEKYSTKLKMVETAIGKIAHTIKQ